MSVLEPGRPCLPCGVRPDVDCPHRPADPEWVKPVQPEIRKPNREFSFLSGIHKFTHPRTGKVYRIQGRGD